MTPTPPPLPPRTVEFRVRYAETDQMGVVYHANYLVWCEIGRTEFIRGLGTSYADVERSGVGLAVSELTMRFHAPARYDDLIRVATRLSAVRSRAITFDYEIVNGQSGLRFVTAQTSLVLLAPGGKPTSLTPLLRTLFGVSS